MKYKEGSVCYLCGRKLVRPTGGKPRDDDFTCDHKIPKVLGGSSKQNNTAPCCRRCNQLKATITLSDNLAILMKLLRQCENDFKVSRITSMQSDVYELHFKKHPSIRVMFISTEIKLNLVTERDDFLDTVIKSLRTSSKSLGVLIGMRGSHTAASKLSNCTVCGKLLKGEVHGGVLICAKCFDHLKQIKATLKSVYDFLNF